MNYGIGNNIKPFKGRSINVSRPIWVYRNLHAQTEDERYSVYQDGLVVAHTDCIMLHDVKFAVRAKGRDKVRATGRKNVHAFVRGRLSLMGGMGISPADKCGLPAKITYNPYKDNGFVCRNLTIDPFVVKGAMVAVMTANGVSAAYLEK